MNTERVSGLSRILRSIEFLLAVESRKKSGNQTAIALIIAAASIALFIPWWLRMSSLSGDAPRWLMEAWRTSNGELPYRDFSYQYPPLSIWMTAGAFRIFGATFATAHLFLAVLAILQMLLLWKVARTVLSERLALLATVFFAGTMFGTRYTLDSIFSLSVYTQSYPLGNVFLLLFLCGILRFLDPKQNSTYWTMAACIVGANGTLLTKPEYGLAMLIAMIVVFVWMAFYPNAGLMRRGKIVGLGLLCCLPACLIYGAYARVVGAKNLINGVTGYGQATLSCPLWPTGYSVVTIIADLLVGGALVALFATYILLRSKRSTHSEQSIAIKPLILVVLGSVVCCVLYIAFQIDNIPTWDPVHNIAVVVPLLVTSCTTWLNPMRWGLLIFVIVIGVCGLLKPRAIYSLVGWRTMRLFVLSIAASVLLSRSLFTHHLTGKPFLVLAAYPLLSVLFVFVFLWVGTYMPGVLSRYLLRSTSHKDTFLKGRDFVTRELILLLSLCFVICLLRGISFNVARACVSLPTKAGVVRVAKKDEALGMYDEIMKHVRPDTKILDLCYGGGFTLASHTMAAGFVTQYTNLKPSQETLERDVQVLKQSPPAMVLVMEPFENTVYTGADCKSGCSFPKFTWLPTETSANHKAYLPLIQFVRSNYDQVATIGQRSLYVYRTQTSQGGAASDKTVP